jgi:hypothetical protein
MDAQNIGEAIKVTAKIIKKSLPVWRRKNESGDLYIDNRL